MKTNSIGSLNSIAMRMNGNGRLSVNVLRTTVDGKQRADERWTSVIGKSNDNEKRMNGTVIYLSNGNPQRHRLEETISLCLRYR
jgi:hypothetical protein